MNTHLRYCVELRFRATGHSHVASFDNPYARAALIAGVGLFSDVIREWEE